MLYQSTSSSVQQTAVVRIQGFCVPPAPSSLRFYSVSSSSGHVPASLCAFICSGQNLYKTEQMAESSGGKTIKCTMCSASFEASKDPMCSGDALAEASSQAAGGREDNK